jgi:hypothetical protein
MAMKCVYCIWLGLTNLTPNCLAEDVIEIRIMCWEETTCTAEYEQLYCTMKLDYVLARDLS